MHTVSQSNIQRYKFTNFIHKAERPRLHKQNLFLFFIFLFFSAPHTPSLLNQPNPFRVTQITVAPLRSTYPTSSTTNILLSTPLGDPTMSRPASESVGAVKRTRAASSCADSVEPPLSRSDHLAYPPTHPPPPFPIRSNPRKRHRPLPVPPNPSAFHPSSDISYCPTSLCLHQAPGPRHRKFPIVLSASASMRDNRTDRHEHADVVRQRPEQSLTRPVARVPINYSLPREDDAEGHLIYKLGEGLHPMPDFPHGRYKILSELGEGTFGKVVECWDRCEGKRVAIKVVRSIAKYREAAKLEIDVLLHLGMHDPDGYFHCVKLFSWFEYQSHICMVFEKLGPSLYDQLRRNRFQPFPLDQVREYAFQLLESVNFVHNLTLIHTDLKPENILLDESSKQSNALKLVDFGSATFERQHHSPVISTRHYRAPEVILGLGWTYPCDLWSIGCILVELYTGQALFQTHENLEHLAMMSGVLGPIPDSMIRRADVASQKYFRRLSSGGKALNWPGGASSKQSIRMVRKIQSLKDIIHGPKAHANFFDLVGRLLSFEPDTRCTSAEALEHPFFRQAWHESDPPVTTPTLSSGSSAGGSNARYMLRRNCKGSSRRKIGVQRRTEPARLTNRRGKGSDQVEDEDAYTPAEILPLAEHSERNTDPKRFFRQRVGNAAL